MSQSSGINNPSGTEKSKPATKEEKMSHVLVNASGDVLTSKAINTERDKDRTQEEVRFTSVILKRNDLTLRHPGDTLEIAMHEGLEQFKRNQFSLLLSSFAAGLNVAFSAMAVAIAYTVAAPLESSLVSKLLVAMVYPLGFIICIMSGAKLFTEHTATALYPVLDRQTTLPRLFKLWGIVLTGNLVGATLSAFLLSVALPVIDAKEGFIIVGHHLVSPTSEQLLISAIFAGWLMAQGGWLVMASTSTLAQMVGIYIVTFIGWLSPLHRRDRRDDGRPLHRRRLYPPANRPLRRHLRPRQPPRRHHLRRRPQLRSHPSNPKVREVIAPV